MISALASTTPGCRNSFDLAASGYGWKHLLLAEDFFGRYDQALTNQITTYI
jgi:hypothetical protein